MVRFEERRRYRMCSVPKVWSLGEGSISRVMCCGRYTKVEKRGLVKLRKKQATITQAEEKRMSERK